MNKNVSGSGGGASEHSTVEHGITGNDLVAASH